MRFQDRKGAAASVFAAVMVLSLASQAALPVGPVPISLQSLAVVLTGALLGPLRGVLAVLAWLALAALGLPLLAEGTGGLAKFTGPSAGFLLAFPFAAAFAGALLCGRSDVGWALLVALCAHAICLIGGGAWLAAAIGPAKAWGVGVLPFLPGAAAKSLAAALVIRAISRRGYASASAGLSGWTTPPAAPAPARRSVPAPRA